LADPNALRIWDVAATCFVSRLTVPGMGGGICHRQKDEVEFSPDGEFLATVGYSGAGPAVLRLWEVGTGREVKALPEKLLWGESWSSDGAVLRTFGANARTGESLGDIGRANWLGHFHSGVGFTALWELASSVPAFRTDRPVTGLAFQPDGTRLLVNDSVWGVLARRERLSLRLRPPATSGLISPAFVGKGQLWGAVGNQSSLTEIRQVAPGEKTYWRRVEGAYIDPQLNEAKVIETLDLKRIAFSPPGDRILLQFSAESPSPFSDKEVAEWMQTTARRAGGVFAGCQNPFLTLPSTFDFVKLGRCWLRWDTSQSPPGLGRYPTAVTFQFIELRDFTKAGWERRWRIPANPNDFHFSPDGRHVVIADGGKEVWTPFGDALIVASNGERVRKDGDGQSKRGEGLQVLDADTGRVVRTLTARPVDYFLFSAVGEFLVAVTRARKKDPAGPNSREKDAEVVPGQGSLYDMATGQELRSWPVEEGTWLTCSVSPDGQLVAAGDAKGILHLWETATGKERIHWHAHDGGCSALAFYPKGHTLLSGGTDGWVKVWDLPTIRAELAAIGLDW
jgi:WD40 repeat protein